MAAGEGLSWPLLLLKLKLPPKDGGLPPRGGREVAEGGPWGMRRGSTEPLPVLTRLAVALLPLPPLV